MDPTFIVGVILALCFPVIGVAAYCSMPKRVVIRSMARSPSNDGTRRVFTTKGVCLRVMSEQLLIVVGNAKINPGIDNKRWAFFTVPQTIRIRWIESRYYRGSENTTRVYAVSKA